jgi:hypothetical protein
MKTLFFRVLLFACVFIACSNKAFSQTDTAVVTAAVVKNTNEITKLLDCKLPQEMFQRIKHMKPAELAVLKEELQTPTREDGEEKLFTVKLRYYADYIIGIIKEAPFNQSNKGVVSDKRINIPVKWVCTPDSMGHEKHSVLMSEMKSYEANYRCKNWKQEDEENEEAQFGKPEEGAPVKKKKKKLFGF